LRARRAQHYSRGREDDLTKEDVKRGYVQEKWENRAREVRERVCLLLRIIRGDHTRVKKRSSSDLVSKSGNIIVKKKESHSAEAQNINFMD